MLRRKTLRAGYLSIAKAYETMLELTQGLVSASFLHMRPSWSIASVRAVSPEHDLDGLEQNS